MSTRITRGSIKVHNRALFMAAAMAVAQQGYAGLTYDLRFSDRSTLRTD